MSCGSFPIKRPPDRPGSCQATGGQGAVCVRIGLAAVSKELNTSRGRAAHTTPPVFPSGDVPLVAQRESDCAIEGVNWLLFPPHGTALTLRPIFGGCGEAPQPRPGLTTRTWAREWKTPEGARTPGHGTEPQEPQGEASGGHPDAARTGKGPARTKPGRGPGKAKKEQAPAKGRWPGGA